MTWFNDAWSRFGKIIPIVEDPSDPSNGKNLTAGPNGGLLIEFPTGATAPLPDDAATQTTLAAILAKIIAAPATAALQSVLNALATTPNIPTAITASDATDTSAITAKGLIVSVGGSLAIRGTGAPSTTVPLVVVAGQYVPVQCSRVMAATTATVVGLA